MDVERELIKKILGDKPVAYHPILAKVVGSASSAIWLSQVLYWDSTLKESRDGWFWKTYEEMEQETALNRHEQDRARSACKEKGIIQEQKKGLPLRIFYRVDWDRLTECLSSLPDADKQVCHTPTNKTDIRRQTVSESTTESTTESGDSKIESPASSQEKPIDIALIVKHAKETPKFDADAEFKAMPSASTGMVPCEHTAATADPHIAEKEFVREYAPVFALICQRAKPITEDRQAARRAFGKHFDITRMNERLMAYQNGDGGDFRKPEATAFWIVNRLEKDLAQRLVTGESWDSIPRFRAED